jgi:pentose-5-phosphate-3-epimerase
VESSQWSADFKYFAREMERIDPYADIFTTSMLPMDLLSPVSFFADLVAGLRPLTKKPFHVHRMTDNPIIPCR